VRRIRRKASMSEFTSGMRGSASASWVGRRDIDAIAGALTSGAYVQRAYLLARRQGRMPAWAAKTAGGQWLFSRAYIEADARENLQTLGVGEAAVLLGTTRRTVQNWIDEGVIEPLGDAEHEKGEFRRILREPFLRNLETFRRRLQTPSNVGKMLRHGKAVPDEVIQRLEAERSARAEESRRPAPQVEPETPIPGPDPAAAKRAAAAQIEDRLRAAARQQRAARERTAPSAQVREAAAALEARLQAARQARRDEAAWEEKASRIAGRIMDAMLDDLFGRMTAALLFNRVAKDQHVPDDIRVRVRREFFGR
jgi:hypothetical protein